MSSFITEIKLFPLAHDTTFGYRGIPNVTALPRSTEVNTPLGDHQVGIESIPPQYTYDTPLAKEYDLCFDHAVDQKEMTGHGSPSRHLNYSADPSVIYLSLAAMAMIDS